MATNIPPHNLGEVCRACVFLIENAEATTAQLMERVKGPDFPLGGKVVTDRATLRKIYEDGTGSVKVQGEWKEESAGKKGRQIVITSIPYGGASSSSWASSGGASTSWKVSASSSTSLTRRSR